jgi:sugar lactone lactonase YvrE
VTNFNSSTLIFTYISALIFCSSAPAQNITTVAGGGPHNLQSLQTGLAQPLGLATDSSGNVYVSLTQLNQIWKITPAGSVNVFAGNGSYPYDTDNVPALSATLNQPQGLAFDTTGNLYVADTAHNRVRKINTSGVITTVAGNGTAGFSGDAAAATAAQLNSPVAVAVDTSGNIYIADQLNHRVRMVTAGGIISTVAGIGVPTYNGDGGSAIAAALNLPSGVAVDSAGVLYIADTLNYRVRKVMGGVITTAAGTGTFGLSGDGGPATAAQLNTVNSVTFDIFNNLYIVEAYDVRIVRAGQLNIQTVAGGPILGYSGDGGSPTSATFRNLNAIAFDPSATSAYLADAGNGRIRKFNTSTTTTFAGNGTLDYSSGSGLLALNASFLTPNTIAVDNAGSLVFSDTGGSSISKLVLSSGGLSTLAGSGLVGTTPDGGAATGPVMNPFALTFNPSGGVFFIEGNRVRKVLGGVYSTVANSSNTPGFAGDGGLATAAQLKSPSGLALASNGDLYISDSQNARIRMISGSTGAISTIAGTGAAGSTGDGGLATGATFNYPYALSLDGAGNLFVSELLGNRIRKIVLSTNVVSTVAGDGSTNYADGGLATATGLSAPFSIFADQSSNLFIADEGHSRVRKVTTGTNIISTVAGNGVFDFTGDGGPATAAAVNPLGITVDRSQNLYIADSSGRVRTTTVTACFFTVSTPVVYLGKSATTGSVTITATNPSCPYSVASSSGFVTITSGASGTGNGTVTFSVSADPGTNRTSTVSIGGQSFQVVQAGVFGQTNMGIFILNNTGPLFVLDANGNGMFDSPPVDKLFSFLGQPGDIAVTGDWNGDGRTKVGIYRNGFWILDMNGNGIYDGPSGGDTFFAFGGDGASYVPVVGDWNGDGRTKVGIYHNGFWSLDTNGDQVFGQGDGFFAFGGNANEVPVVGDWNGDHRSKIGIYYQGKWVLD